MRYFLLILPVALLFSCHQGSQENPPPVTKAPASLSRLRVVVYNATQASVQRSGEGVPGYTIALRGAVQRNLVRAGYTVVVNPDEPYDLVAKIDGDWPFQKPGTATLSLKSPRGEVITQISGLVNIVAKAEIDEASAVSLVEAITASAEVAAFAGRLGRPQANEPSVAVPQE